MRRLCRLAPSRGAGELRPKVGLACSSEVRVDDLAALGRMADNFESARAAADAAAGEWLEVEAENERLKLLLALALRGWASSLGGSE